MGKRKRNRRRDLWISFGEMAKAPGHPFYERVNKVLGKAGFDDFVEQRCAQFYAAGMGRPSLAPGIYIRLLVVGYFEGLDSERGMAWRAADSLALREFSGLKLSESPPDHSTISRTRRLIDVETHEAVFSWALKQLAESGLLKGKTIGIDATTLEGEAGSLGCRVCESSANSRWKGASTVATTGRIAGTPLCPSLRDGWDETESPSRWGKPLEAIADSRQCLQPGSTDAPAARRRDAQGSPRAAFGHWLSCSGGC